MGEKPVSTDEASGAMAEGAEEPAGASAAEAASEAESAAEAGQSGFTGEPIPGIDVKLGKNPGAM